MALERFYLTDKVAIVTGSGRGIGKVIAKVFAEAGADVVCTSRTQGEIEATAEEIKSMGRRSIAIPCDVTKSDQVEQLVKQSKDTFGHIDILVNNAAGGTFTKMMEMNEHQFETDLRFSLTSAFICSKAVGKVMLEQKSGAIINISSRESAHPSLGLPAYGAAKAGMNSITQTLAWELAPYVRINAIRPGPIWTEVTDFFPEKLRDIITEAVPLKRWGKPEDVALMALYLASPAGDWITGRLFDIDGGIEFSAAASQEMFSMMEQ